MNVSSLRCGIVALALSSGTAACDGKTAPIAVMSQEDKSLIEKVKAKERVKALLQSNPSTLVRGGKCDIVDKGIINTYSRATAIVFENTSEFDVADPAGRVTYVQADGTELGTVPFQAKGEVRAGSSARLEVTAGELSGGTVRTVVVVERVHVRS